MRAVIVIDVEEHGNYYADVYRKDADDRFEGRYYLKTFPQKIYAEFPDSYKYGFADGWNRCLEEMQK